MLPLVAAPLLVISLGMVGSDVFLRMLRNYLEPKGKWRKDGQEKIVVVKRIVMGLWLCNKYQHCIIYMAPCCKLLGGMSAKYSFLDLSTVIFSLCFLAQV